MKNIINNIAYAGMAVFAGVILMPAASFAAAPTCTLNASPDHISDGEITTLVWAANDADSVSLSTIGSVADYGSYIVAPSDTTTYTLVATNGDGSTVCSKTVTVGGVSDALSCSFGITPAYLSGSASTATLYWNTENADSVFIDYGIGLVEDDGSRTVYNIYNDRTYTLTAVNGSKTKTCTAHVTKENSTSANAPTCSIYANPMSTSYNGQTTLTWTSSYGAVRAELNQGVGAVQKNGSRVVGDITSTRTYTLSVWNADGASNTCSTTVFADRGTPTCYLNSNADYIAPGQSVTLNWSAGNATSAYINTLGSVSTSGSRTVYPSQSTTYTLTTQGVSGSNTCQKTVYVGNTPIAYGGTIATPGYYYGQNLALSYVPYTGPNDALYASVLLALVLLSGFGAYRAYKVI